MPWEGGSYPSRDGGGLAGECFPAVPRVGNFKGEGVVFDLEPFRHLPDQFVLHTLSAEIADRSIKECQHILKQRGKVDILLGFCGTTGPDLIGSTPQTGQFTGLARRRAPSESTAARYWIASCMRLIWG